MKIGDLTNKGTIMKKIEEIKSRNVWITDTMVNGKCVDSEDDAFDEKDLYLLDKDFKKQ